VALAGHALGAGVDAVAVIGPPYFRLDEEELLRHFVAAANACDPLPFYVYEFEARAGYAIPPNVIERLRDRSPNLVGLKVSDTPFERVGPYLVDGLDVFIGFETLVLQGMDAGAIGSVSGLASAWPETVAELVHERSADAHRRVNELRDGLAGIPFHAALKSVLADRDVLMHEDVRPPLRPLTDEERILVSKL
jgi:dihydrodipicolinate synthase/N-acetylneuraminate lyase